MCQFITILYIHTHRRKDARIDKLQEENRELYIENLSLKGELQRDKMKNDDQESVHSSHNDVIQSLHQTKNPDQDTLDAGTKMKSELINKLNSHQKLLHNLEQNVSKLARESKLNLINDTLKSMTNEIRDVKELAKNIDRDDDRKEMENMLVKYLQPLQNDNEKILNQMNGIKERIGPGLLQGLKSKLELQIVPKMVQDIKKSVWEISNYNKDKLKEHITYVLQSDLGPIEGFKDHLTELRQSINMDSFHTEFREIMNRVRIDNLSMNSELKVLLNKFSWMRGSVFIGIGVFYLVIAFIMWIICLLFTAPKYQHVNPFW